MSDQDLDALLANPEEAIFWADAADAEDRLVDFIQMTWSAVEPTRPFVRGWAIDAICEHLEAVHQGLIRRLVMNVPPGFMKSLTSDVFFPAWEWGPRNKPGLRYVCASYSHDLTLRDNDRTRMLINDSRYQKAWGDRFQINPDQNAKQKFANNHRGFKLATSVHGLGTGERGDRVIIDDPHNVLEAESDAKRNSALQWFTEVMPTRVNDAKTAAFIVIMQRVHENDVTGLILEKELGYTHLCIPMHYDPEHPIVKKANVWPGWSGDPRTEHDELAFPERYGQAEVDELIKVMMSWGGTYSVAGQMEQRPEPRGGGMVKKEWFEVVDSLPDGYGTLCRGWDFASTEGGEGAGSASIKFGEWWDTNGDSDLCILDCWWDRVSPGELYEVIRRTVTADGYDCFQSLPQDPGQSGKYQVNDLLDIFRGYDFEFSLESGDKVVRFRPFAAQAEMRAKVGRRIKILRADWNDVFLDHISKFPMGRWKDIPDATSRSYGGIVRRGGGSMLIPGGSVAIKRDEARNGSN
jgi:predicted phage terminase large subunit-like protein